MVCGTGQGRPDHPETVNVNGIKTVHVVGKRERAAVTARAGRSLAP